MKGILYSLVERSAASIAPYTTLGTVPTAIFLALITLLVMLYSDVGVFAACRIIADASLPRGCIPMEFTDTLLQAHR